MEKLPRSDYDDPNSLTSFNIIVEGEGEGLISKIFSKFKTAVTGPQQQQQVTSPSSSIHTISLVLSNENGGFIDQDSYIGTSNSIIHQKTPTSAINIGGEGSSVSGNAISSAASAAAAGTTSLSSTPSNTTATPMPTKINNESSSTVTMTTTTVENTNSDNKLNRIPTSTSSVATITEKSLQSKNRDGTAPLTINTKKVPSSTPPTGSFSTSNNNTPTASNLNKTSSSTIMRSTTKHIIIDEDQNQQQEISYPPIIPLKRTSSVDSDTQSVMTTFSVSNTNSLGRILNRLRGGESVDNSNKDFWMPDEQCRECFDCNAPFNLFRRKHHCRTCGRIFCSKCLGNSIRNTNQILRVCNDCYLKFESYKADDTISIQDAYGYASSSIIDLSASSTTTSSQLLSQQQQQLQQKTYLLPNNDDEDSSDDEFERSTNSLEIQRPNIDLHFSQSTSSQHHYATTTNDVVTSSGNDVGIKKLLTNTFLRSTPRSRTNTMNSLGIDTSLAVLEGTRQQTQQQLNSPMPFRRNSFLANANAPSAHPDNSGSGSGTHVLNNTHHHYLHSHSQSISICNNNGNGTNTPAQAEYYEDDDSKSRWDRNPRNLLNFLGGERPASGIFNNFFFEDYAPTPDSPTTSSTMIPVQSTSTSTQRASWYMRPPPNNSSVGNNLERSNSMVRRRLSLTEGGGSGGGGNGFNVNNNNMLMNSPTSTTSATRYHRIRTKSLMRNTPITTASIMMETNQSSATSSGNESSGSVNNYGTSPAAANNTTNAAGAVGGGGGINNNNNALVVARCPTPDLDQLRSQILSVSANTSHPVTVATHEQWDESFLYLMRNILRHMLVECGVETRTHQDWEDMTMRLLLNIADQVQPHIRVKDTFNMNHYVKIKKLPGGLPKDSFSVSGVVMSKNVCHKDMTRKIENPRILILNFDLDGFSNSSSSNLSTTTAAGGNGAYNNNNNNAMINDGFGGSGGGGGPRQEYLKFDRLLAWERDHMNALVNQIVGLKPSIVLVAANVSRTVIERLNKAKIVVAYNIKKQKLDAIARCADATVFNYKNELWNAKSVPPGKCGMFETLTVMHEFLPNRRKTFLMFTQCPKERGATIVLRGGTVNTLYVIKFIMKFMVTVVNNINLEAQLRKDFIELRRWNMPIYDDMSFDGDEGENELMKNSNEDDSSTLHQARGSSSGGRPTTNSSFVDGNSVDMQQVDAQSISAVSVAESQVTVNTVDISAAKKKAQQQFHQDTIIVEDDDICLTAINTVLKKYQNTILSISPGVTLPAPHILLKLRDAQKKLIGLIRERLGASITGTTLATSPISTVGVTVDNASIQSSSSPPPPPPLQQQQQDPNNENMIGDNNTTPPAATVIPPIPTDLAEMPFYLKAFDVYLEHDLEYRHYQDLHLQAWYIFKKYIDSIHQYLSPIYHQAILVHRTTNPMNNHTIPCEKAVLEPYNYYDPTSDYTLGQYILNATKEAYTKCGSKMCGAKLIQHDKTYSHGNAQIKMQVFYEDDNGDEDHPFLEEKIEISRDEYLRKIPIFIRTKCHICKIIHSWKPMSDLLQRFSFGKFLELLFYQSESIPLYKDDQDGGSGSDYFVADGDEDDGCPHGLYRDHTISFRIQNLSVNFTHAMVKVVEVHPPPLHLRFSQKQQMAIKDASLDSTRSKIAKFFDSIIERNKAFSYDIVQPNMIDTCKEYLQELSQEALKNKKNLLQKLQLEYATSAPTDTLQLNNVLAELQNHAVNWDLKYIDFARRFVRPERELRRLTTNHLRKMFPAESLYTTITISTAPVVSNLSLRTKRAIEAADLPLLDVGLDNSPTLSPFGVTGMSNHSTVTDDVCAFGCGGDVTLKEQPGLGESPTESYPWFDELKRFDQMFMQDTRTDEDTNVLGTSFGSKMSIYGGTIINKKKNDVNDITKSLPSSPGQVIIKGSGSNNNKQQDSSIEKEDESHDLDPSVARRLSLELMKDAPKKKKEQVVVVGEKKQQQQQQQQKQQKSLLEHSQIEENKKSPSPPPPSPMSSSAALTVPLTVTPVSTANHQQQQQQQQHKKQQRKQQDEFAVTEYDDSSRLIHHAAGLPVLSSTAYKRLVGFLPDPIVGKSKSSPVSGNSTSSGGGSQQQQQQQQKNASLRRSQFYENSSSLSSNLLLDSTPANATTTTTSAIATSSTTNPHTHTPSKPSFYRGSPYAVAGGKPLPDRSSIAYRYGFMGPPSNNSPPILPVIDKKLGINTHIKNPMMMSNNSNNSITTAAALIHPKTLPSKSSQQQSMIIAAGSGQQQQQDPVRPRSRTMAIVGGASTGNLLTYQQQNNMKTIIGTPNLHHRSSILGGGRIPIPTSNFITTLSTHTTNGGGNDQQQQQGHINKSITTAAAFASIKFPGSIGIGASSSHQHSHLPIPVSHHYHHGRKLSEGKIRHIRQRLPSKASLEPYTKIKEIIATHDESSSDEEEDDGISEEDDDDDEDEDDEADDDDESDAIIVEGHSTTLLLSEQDDSDELLPVQYNKAFSLMHTDEYDESLGRELVPSILELQQFNRQHQLSMLKDDTLPYLSVESGMVGENSRKMTHDETSSGGGGTFGDHHHLTKTLSRNAIMEAVLRSSSNNSSISLGDTGSSTTSLDWSPGVGGKNSIMKAITYVLAEKSISNLLPLEYPFSPTEHIFGDSNILVREDEPSSIISYMLGSTFYNEKLHLKREMRMSKAAAGGGAASSIFNNSSSEKEKSLNTDQQQQQQETKPFFSEMFPETDERERPWKFSFKGGSTSFTCKIYFAEQFDMLRKSCGCDDIFISSLARCTTWDASGGKSGSIFLKTKDERFLIKQISKYEMDAFLGSANKYFLYMFNEVFDKGIPTVLCKIFGLYRIGFYNNVSGKSMKMDILVMENLFYETSVKKVYDLKGSMRNRYAEKTGKDVEVFLDENLVEIISKTPLYMRVDTKYNLSDSLFNDTQFLLSLDVMDYSLLVGFDEDTNEIIVGIVDFIRTFTWDKKLESWVKESGMLGGGKKDPTIVSPKMYRKRFRSAIDLYFCMIPDFWTLSFD